LGKTDDQIRAFLVARYGEFILLKPNFGYHTALLWGAPLLILLLGLGLIVYFRPQLNKQPEPALSEAEESELADLLKARSKD